MLGSQDQAGSDPDSSASKVLITGGEGGVVITGKNVWMPGMRFYHPFLISSFLGYRLDASYPSKTFACIYPHCLTYCSKPDLCLQIILLISRKTINNKPVLIHAQNIIPGVKSMKLVALARSPLKCFRTASLLPCSSLIRVRQLRVDGSHASLPSRFLP